MKSMSILWLEEGQVNAEMSLLDGMKSNSLQGLASKFFYTRVPCAYAYSTMVMCYGTAGKFDEACSLLD